MDEQQKQEKEIVKDKISNIIQDKRQFKVGIPKEMVEDLKINPKEDVIFWSIVSNENKEISLEGHLIKGGRKSNENTKI